MKDEAQYMYDIGILPKYVVRIRGVKSNGWQVRYPYQGHKSQLFSVKKEGGFLQATLSAVKYLRKALGKETVPVPVLRENNQSNKTVNKKLPVGIYEIRTTRRVRGHGEKNQHYFQIHVPVMSRTKGPQTAKAKKVYITAGHKGDALAEAQRIRAKAVETYTENALAYSTRLTNQMIKHCKEAEAKIKMLMETKPSQTEGSSDTTQEQA